MDFYAERKIKFKAWNTETKLLMRLDSIQCVKGELHKPNHILLQFTGFTDKDHEELYDMDVVLLGSEKYVIFWNDDESCWSFSRLANGSVKEKLKADRTKKMIRICSYFQSDPEFNIRKWYE